MVFIENLVMLIKIMDNAKGTIIPISLEAIKIAVAGSFATPAAENSTRIDKSYDPNPQGKTDNSAAIVDILVIPIMIQKDKVTFTDFDKKKMTKESINQVKIVSRTKIVNTFLDLLNLRGLSKYFLNL